ncbi:hypothetical protein CAPTEDRAFT_148161 [Capitella teleta]|uniref:Transmembrane protein 107 n=2 Tax=Capitella teleta TaxID=283909 RepID=R7V2C9_CAPTE|nr:hypothetical protein CAPTEDRAFT_148161 [Capitella teleta]|eukprot:ELU12637.1 hypothetical protein CAPTEDRAFT_148161 [Capitella teleta]
MAVSGLVPARFLCMIAHLVLTIVILLSRDSNVKACLPLNYSPNEYDSKDTELIVGLSVALGLLVFELVGFMGGISMFMSSQAMISTTLHASAAVSLAYFIFDAWPCGHYWYIFGFCSAFPAVTEIFVMIGSFAFNKGI